MKMRKQREEGLKEHSGANLSQSDEMKKERGQVKNVE